MDFLSWLPAPSLPNVAAAIRAFPPAPALTKPVKTKAIGGLSEIAVRAMNNQVGLIAYQIAKAQALGFTEVIPQLAQQLQIEVDSLKNVERADMNLIEELMEPVRRRKIAWLGDRKKPDAFTTRPILSYGSDVVSKLSNAVSKYFIPPSFRVAPLKDFAYIFPAADDRWFAKAAVRQAEYKVELRQAIEANSDEQRRAVVGKYQQLLAACPDRSKAAAAIWQYAHNPQSTNANFAFIACLPQILQQLEALQLQTFNVFHVQALYDQPVLAEVVWNGQYKKLVVRDGTKVGDVPAHVPLTTVVVQLSQKGKAVIAEVVGEEVLSF